MHKIVQIKTRSLHLIVTSNISTVKRCDVDFDRGMIVGARRADLRISAPKQLISWGFQAQQSPEFLLWMVRKTKSFLWAAALQMETPWDKVRGEWPHCLKLTDRKATVTQTDMFYYCGELKSYRTNRSQIWKWWVGERAEDHLMFCYCKQESDAASWMCSLVGSDLNSHRDL